MPNMSLDRKVNCRRIKRLCRSKAANSPAILLARVLRNRFSLAQRAIWVSQANGLGELYDVLMVDLFPGERSLLPCDSALFFVAEAFPPARTQERLIPRASLDARTFCGNG